jgi:hypothetical protein
MFLFSFWYSPACVLFSLFCCGGDRKLSVIAMLFMVPVIFGRVSGRVWERPIGYAVQQRKMECRSMSCLPSSLLFFFTLNQCNELSSARLLQLHYHQHQLSSSFAIIKTHNLRATEAVLAAIVSVLTPEQRALFTNQLNSSVAAGQPSTPSLFTPCCYPTLIMICLLIDVMYLFFSRST